MSKWKIDPDHSVASFSIRHMMVSNIRGQATGVTGMIFFDPPDVQNASVESVIQVKSLSTGNEKRDAHLFSRDFFDAEKFPTLTFKSTKAEKTGFNTGKVTGDLTIRGMRRPVTMNVSFYGPVKGPLELGGETTLGFSAVIAINREDFAVMWNVSLDDGGLMVGREVLIRLDIEADLVE